ncbi:MAG: ATP-binding cassette domain-containing protein, partial [Clostridia bacterium]|nr:ATP-binding cassette domain-containing protein [Clostridia bacterium]
DAALWQVLTDCRLADFLRGEQGLDTPLLENAGNLSGGQKQRLALARAILHNSAIYIFDEATSNIDMESEETILSLIHRLTKEKTVIMISHRLANLAQADTIYVMENGSVAESGSHAQLLKQNGVYAGLWQTQQALEQFGLRKEA